MNALPSLLLPLVVLLANGDAPRCTLEMTIRLHTDTVLFGDPLYVEVTIVNRGEEPVSGRRPDLWLNTLRFTMSHSKSRMSYTYSEGGAYGDKPIVFEPHKPVKYYCYFFLPRFVRYDNPFSKLFRGGGELGISCTYGLRPEVTLNSRRHYVSVKARNESEIASLAYWVKDKKEAKREDRRWGPTPADFRLPVNLANRKEMGEFAFHTVLDGELGGLVVLSLKLRDLYELPPESREAGNRKLVEWLLKQPEVKCQVLLRKLRSIALNYNMTSTFEALGGGDRNRPSLVPEGGIWDIKPEEVEPEEVEPENASRSDCDSEAGDQPIPAREGAAASNLEITIRPHAKQLVFGDPLYLEVAIANRGKEPVSALPELWKGFRVVLRVGDGRERLEAILAPRGQPAPSRLEPGETVKIHRYAFLPGYRQFNGAFWKPVGEGRVVTVRGAYRLDCWGSEITSTSHEVLVMPRNESEIAAIWSWSRADGKGSFMDFGPGAFGTQLPFRAAFSREQLDRLVTDVPSGELGDLLRLTLKFRDICDSPPESREAGNRQLVEWLRKQPDIKRQALLRQLRRFAVIRKMPSTFEALGGGDIKSPYSVPEGAFP